MSCADTDAGFDGEWYMDGEHFGGLIFFYEYNYIPGGPRDIYHMHQVTFTRNIGTSIKNKDFAMDAYGTPLIDETRQIIRGYDWAFEINGVGMIIRTELDDVANQTSLDATPSGGWSKKHIITVLK